MTRSAHGQRSWILPRAERKVSTMRQCYGPLHDTLYRPQDVISSHLGRPLIELKKSRTMSRGAKCPGGDDVKKRQAMFQTLFLKNAGRDFHFHVHLPHTSDFLLLLFVFFLPSLSSFYTSTELQNISRL